MKKLVFILFVLFSVSLYAQYPGEVVDITVDTVMGNENIYLTTGQLSGDYNTVVLNALFSKISSAAGGTAYVQGSIDGTTYETLTSQDDLFIFYTNDTITVTDAGSMTLLIKDNPFNFYRFFIDGDVNDTVKITSKYVFKK